jgi:hypothetical protein
MTARESETGAEDWDDRLDQQIGKNLLLGKSEKELQCNLLR